MSSIDALLYRTLKTGSQFEGLIPAYQGSEYNFDTETDNSTTYDTLRFMAQWSNKYAYQMKRIAPLLKGATIQETVNNIYQFLYSHFQYKLDGSLQNLYSPSAAWHFRKTGFDCKTYSLLASILLQNLKMPHSFRMVQQAGIMPGEWSHVYVIVPDNNTEYVIDATTHSNKQVSFTKKHDYIMKHLGLASPYINGLGCACQGTPITRNGLGAPGNLENTIANFHVFLNELEKKGFPKEVTDKMLALVRYNVENGIDPNMHEIVQKAILGQKGLGYIAPVSNLTPAGTNNYNYSLPTSSYNLPSSFTAPSTTSFGSNILSNAPSLIGNFSVGGVKISSISNAVTGLISGNPLAAIGLITSLIPIDKTFGAVFANGFNLSCWGSSTPPNVMKELSQKDIPAVYEATLGKGISQQNLNTFLDYMNHMIYRCRQRVPQVVSCSGKGLTQYADAAEVAKKEVLTQLATVVDLQQLPSVKITRVPSGFVFAFWYLKTFDKPYDSERYNIIARNQEVPTNNTKNKTESTTPLLIGGALLALKLLI